MVEMIGVLAIIGILASVATPRIVQAMRDAKVSSAVSEVGTLRSAVAQFYEDTGLMPSHNDRSNNASQHQLLKNTTAGLTGWDGPYVEKQLRNPFEPARNYLLASSTNDNHRFDFDGDGSLDQTGTVGYLRIDLASADTARRISDALDKDGANTNGTTAWYAAGRAKLTGGSAPGNGAVQLIIYMGDF